MGNGDINVGNESPIRKSGQLRMDSSPKTEEKSSGLCGAMAQQGDEFRGNMSAPQKFVHLVGCRDRKVRPAVEARQYSNPVKR